MRILLAPMEGLADDLLRDVLTGVGGYDACVSEFIRVSDTRLPRRAFLRLAPELARGARTRAGTPVIVQLLGSDPERLAANAARAAEFSPLAIDLNFGCPAPLVNRHGGGAALLGDPARIEAIVRAVRAAVPAHLSVTAKMRLGLDHPEHAVALALAMVAGGAAELTVHARTRSDAYSAPARWEWLARVRAAVPVPVIANGDIFTPADWQRCRALTGCEDVMLGRGAVADPWLAWALRDEVSVAGSSQTPINAPCAPRDQAPLERVARSSDHSARLAPLLLDYWRAVLGKVVAKHAPGRLKSWLVYLARRDPWAAALSRRLRPMRDPAAIGAALHEACAEIAMTSKVARTDRAFRPLGRADACPLPANPANSRLD